MRILVTGAAGFIGSHLAISLQQKHEVIALDDLSSGRKENLAGFTGEFVKADAAAFDYSTLGELDAILYQAANADTAINDYALMAGINAEGFRGALEYAARKNCRVVYATSAAVYGNLPAPQAEGGGVQPLNAYSNSKVEMEKVAAEYVAKGVSALGLRYFNAYGPREDGKGRSASIAWHLAKRMWQGGRPMVFGDGTQYRDFVYVKDLVKANELALKSGATGVVNAGSGKATDFNTLVKLINAALGLSLEPKYVPNPFTGLYQTHTHADLAKAREQIGFAPDWEIEAGLADYLKAELAGIKVETQ